MNRERPRSITVISYLMIGIGVLNLVTSALLFNNPTVRQMAAASPIPLPVQYALTVLGVTMMVVSGIGMIRAQNWARWLYVIWTAAGTIFGLAMSPTKLVLVPSIAVYLVVVFFLFRPGPNRYFAAESSPDAQGT